MIPRADRTRRVGTKNKKKRERKQVVICVFCCFFGLVSVENTTKISGVALLEEGEKIFLTTLVNGGRETENREGDF